MSASNLTDPTLLADVAKTITSSMDAFMVDVNLVEHEAEIPLPAKPTMDRLIHLLRRVLSKKHMQMIILEKKKPLLVRWYGPENDSWDSGIPESSSPFRMLSHLEVSTFSTTGQATHILGELMLALSAKGLSLTHVLVGSKEKLAAWAGLDDRVDRLAGGLILSDSDQQDHTVVWVAAQSPYGGLSDAEVAWVSYL